MDFDYISDLHLDSWFKDIDVNDSDFFDFWEDLSYSKNSENLIIAGDIGHCNEQNYNVLKKLKMIYKNVIFVLGNHDLFSFPNKEIYLYLNKKITLIKKFNSYKDRINDMKNLIKNEEGIYLLDGNIIEIDGIKIGGTMGWYDGHYYKRYKSNLKLSNIQKLSIEEMFKNFMPDSYFITPEIKFNHFFAEEFNKIKNIYDKVDIMITHISPLSDPKYQNPFFVKSKETSFFNFNGDSLLSNFKGFWIFGHSHFIGEFKIFKGTYLINGLGYNNEMKEKTFLKKFSINKNI